MAGGWQNPVLVDIFACAQNILNIFISQPQSSSQKGALTSRLNDILPETWLQFYDFEWSLCRINHAMMTGSVCIIRTVTVVMWWWMIGWACVTIRDSVTVSVTVADVWQDWDHSLSCIISHGQVFPHSAHAAAPLLPCSHLKISLSRWTGRAQKTVRPDQPNYTTHEHQNTDTHMLQFWLLLGKL